MADIKEIKQLAERFVNHIKYHGVDIAENEIPRIYIPSDEVFQNIKTILIQCGYLYLHRPDNIVRYALTTKGQRFKTFEEEDKKEGAREKLDEKIKKLSLRNYRSQQIIPWVALAISLCSTFISYNSYLISKNKEETGTKRLEKRLDSPINQQSVKRPAFVTDSITRVK